MPPESGQYIMFAPREEYENGTFDVNKMMKPPVPYDKATYKHPTEKISANFLDFLDPLLEMLGHDSPEEDDYLYQLGMTIWDSVVLDTVRGNTVMVDKMRRKLAEEMPHMSIVLEQLINRKMSDFGHDQRLVLHYSFIPDPECGFRVRVEAGEVFP
ncbi:MAG: hypothetical protein PHQ75_06555 [Thermoguttaceae bacterium]|nr:hypothetical protein [Thermoguttaceae bacterium]